MGLPPSEAGATHETTDSALLFELALTPVGAPGGPRGVAGDDATESPPVPAAFDAVTVNV
ncbi:unannotated protein [freshwater metagenome]|uniref:Unannotated protein n=1 Tax=freshwater metagenome TaxID=449393 RepID=A0A6J5YKT4_9ZZZZ